MPSKRLFVGTFLSDADKSHVGELKAYDERLSSFWNKKIRWVRQDKLHLTWLFLGDVDVERIDEVDLLLREILQKQPPINLTYSKSLFWPNSRYAKHFVLVPPEVPENVANLAKVIKQKLRLFIEHEEKGDYRPHITLARFDRSVARPLTIPDWFPLQNALPIQHDINQIDLIESHIGAVQDSYVPIKSYLLRSPD